MKNCSQYALAAMVASLVAASACSSPEPNSDLDLGKSFDSTTSSDTDTTTIDASEECPKICNEPCTYVSDVEMLPFNPPSNLPEQEVPITFESMEGLPEDVSGFAASGDDRWPGYYHHGSYVPFGESFRASVGIQSSMRATTEGPYRVQLGVLVDYEFVEFTYRAPMPGRESDFANDTVTEDVFELPDFPIIIDFELAPEVLGVQGLHDVVFLVRISDEGRTDAHRYMQRSTIFYGGNAPVTTHPCFELGPTVEVTEQESKLFRGTYFTYVDETTYREQSVDKTQEWVSADQSSIELTLGIPPSQRVERSEMPEVFFLFRNEDLLFKEYRARHSSDVIDVDTQLSDRRLLTIDLPLNEDRFEIWGFAIQYPFEPEIDYATGDLNFNIEDAVDSPTGSLKTPTYRIQRESPE